MDTSFTATIVGGQEELKINPAVVKWFAGRGINPGNLQVMGVSSGKRQSIGDGNFEVIQDSKGDLIVFPYRRNGEVVMEKYRGANKTIFQRPGGKKHFWNADVLEAESLQDGSMALVIVEGEIDLLSVLEAGYPYVVSVPDGAPPATDEPLPEIDPEHDTKYSFIINDWEALKLIKRIVIASDNDGPGKRLAEELVRRLGRPRCSFVTYPEDCKDCNDVLVKHGLAELQKVIFNPKPYPVSGVYDIDDLPPEPDLNPVSTGFVRLDEYLKPFYPAFMVVTGMAGSGKSSWVNQLVAQMSFKHGWAVAIASFEMRVKPFVTDVLAQSYREMGGSPERLHRWLKDQFVFIAPEPSEADEAFDIDWLIERAITAVIRKGIRILVIDPWNEIEHAVKRGESLTDYTGRAIRALKRFGREFEVLVIVVAHPTKRATEKKPEELSLYDVSDSSHFANKADFGVVICRRGQHALDYVSSILVRKVRYQPVSGVPGQVELCYDPINRTFGQ